MKFTVSELYGESCGLGLQGDDGTYFIQVHPRGTALSDAGYKSGDSVELVKAGMVAGLETKRIAELASVCRVLIDTATRETVDGDECSACGVAFSVNGAASIEEADHEEWCPVPMAFKALKGGE